MGNRPEFVAAASGGNGRRVIVPISTYIEQPELDYILRHSDAAVLLHAERLLAHDYVEALTAVCPDLLGAAPGHSRSARFPFLRAVSVIGLRESMGAIVPADTFLAEIGAQASPRRCSGRCARESRPLTTRSSSTRGNHRPPQGCAACAASTGAA